MAENREDRTSAFIRATMREKTPALEKSEEEALTAGVPIIRPQMQTLLRTLLLLKKPATILEIGTAVGFSALFMAEYAPADAHITTIELDAKRAAQARENFRHYDAAAHKDPEEKITLLEGDAAEILPTLSEPFDFIFMDGAKGQYLPLLPDVLRLLSPGGVLLSDNVWQEGTVMESKYALEHRARSTHERMRAYLYELCHHPDLETALLSAEDGIAVSVRRDAGGTD